MREVAKAKTISLNFRFSTEEQEALERIRQNLESQVPIGVARPTTTDALKFAIMSSAGSSSVAVDLTKLSENRQKMPDKPVPKRRGAPMPA